MKTPEPLSSTARQWLELGSAVRPPTPAECERMDRALAPLFNGSQRLARPSVDERSRSRPAQHMLGLGGAKLALAMGALAATVVTSFWLGRFSTLPNEAGASDASPSLARASHAPAELAPSPVEVPSALARAELPQPRTEGRKAPRAAVGGHDEIEGLARVEAALRRGQPGQALDLLAREKPRQLVEQAAALRAVADCQLGRATAAEAARDVLRRWPASPFEMRIREACEL